MTIKLTIQFPICLRGSGPRNKIKGIAQRVNKINPQIFDKITSGGDYFRLCAIKQGCAKIIQKNSYSPSRGFEGIRYHCEKLSEI